LDRIAFWLYNGAAAAFVRKPSMNGNEIGNHSQTCFVGMTMKQHTSKTQFVVCVKNEGYPVSLELRKIYQVISDARAAEQGFFRVIDESGKDYLYPADYFVAIELPQAVEKVFALAT
jgi:hypothetical protein